MSPLPQRKKTPEELAKLRESLGIPGAAPAADESAPTETDAAEPPPAAEPAVARTETPSAAAVGPAADTAATESRLEPKPVRSLKKSEREHALEPKSPAPAEGKLPTSRHSARELDEIRRREALSIQSPAVHLQAMTAHPALLILGYVLALGGGVGGLAVAAFIFAKKKRSTHHAGFMAVIALLVIVFGALYLFPQLRHAS